MISWLLGTINKVIIIFSFMYRVHVIIFLQSAYDMKSCHQIQCYGMNAWEVLLESLCKQPHEWRRKKLIFSFSLFFSTTLITKWLTDSSLCVVREISRIRRFQGNSNSLDILFRSTISNSCVSLESVIIILVRRRRRHFPPTNERTGRNFTRNPNCHFFQPATEWSIRVFIRSSH